MGELQEIVAAPEVEEDTSVYPELEYSGTILNCLNKQRSENTKLCDINLAIGEAQIPAHRAVLAAASAYFSAMFSADMKESSSNVVTMKDVDADVMTTLIDFVYTGKLGTVNSENVETLLQHSTLLQLDQASKICCDFLEQQLEPLNCIGIRRFAALHQCKEFLLKIDNFIREHFMEVVNSEEFVTIPHSVFKSLLAEQTMKVDTEEQVYNAVMKWVRHDAERCPKLHLLLSELKLPLLSKQFLMNEVDKEVLIKCDLKCRDLLDEAKNYHLVPESHASARSWRTRPRFSTAGLLFAVGGKETGEIITDKAECFCLYEKKWKPVASLNTQRQQLCVCEAGGNIYAIAGTDGTTRMSSVEMYSLEDNTWTETTPLQVCRSGAAAVSLADRMYVLSGYDGRICLRSVERFDSENEHWDYITPMNTGRSFPGACTLGGRIYVVGGNDGNSFLNTCEVYDPVSDRWSHIAPMCTARAGIGCAVQDGVLYVAGGFDGNQRLDIVEIYEPRMDAWTVTTPMNFSRDGVSLASYGGFIHAIGGIDGPSYLSSVEYYDPDDDEWYTAFPMQTSRAAAGVAILISDKYLCV